MNSRTTQRFRNCIINLPEAVRADARAAFRLFQHDPYAYQLRFKCVRKRPLTYSVRINSAGYRALGIREGNTIEWYWAGPHDEYERLIG